MPINFHNWLELREVAAPAKPSKITRRSIIKNAGTNAATPVTEFRFNTKLGNTVKVHFAHKQAAIYDVYFYVNDKMADDASQTENSNRDPEVLPGVLHVMKEKADVLKAQELTFEAINGSPKVMKNMNSTPYAQKVLTLLQPLEHLLTTHPVKMIQPSENLMNLARKFGKPPPVARPDLDTSSLFHAIGELKKNLNSHTYNPSVHEFIEKLLSVDWALFHYDPLPLVQALRTLEGSWLSKNDQGWMDSRNRREGVYEKLMQRHFSDEWNIEKRGTFFTLTRK